MADFESIKTQPGRRTRRRASRRSRMLRLVLPFAFLLGLVALSAGTIAIVEVAVPTRATVNDAAYAERMRAEARESGNSFEFVFNDRNDQWLEKRAQSMFLEDDLMPTDFIDPLFDPPLPSGFERGIAEERKRRKASDED
jgi:hypothetical protein